jgi:DNA-binding NtrC family response regulator
MEAESTVQTIQLAQNCSEDSPATDSPGGISELRDRVAEAERGARRQHSLHLGEESKPEPDFEGIAGHSPLMREIFTRIRRIAPFYLAALITGERRERGRTWRRAHCIA